MDIYVLDSLLRRTAIVDLYESFIWTERYSSYGDFELVVRADRGVRNLLPEGSRITILESRRVMTVETVEARISDDGIAQLVFTGTSLERDLENRVAWYSMTTNDQGERETSWIHQGLPADIARSIFENICFFTVSDPMDSYPFLINGPSPFPKGNIPEPFEPVEFQFEIDTLYNTIKRVCDMYNLGFRILRNGDSSELYFEVYTGTNRTTLQTINPAVVFSIELDNLSGTSEFSSMADYKNVAYVFGKNGTAIAYAGGANESTTGFDRRILIVKADNIDLPMGEELTNALLQRGREALSEHRQILAFDGEIPQNGGYEYDVDYSLGDLVEFRNRDGTATNMLVTEQIFISDSEGVRKYPTLTINQVISSGSWYAWDAGQVWDAADGFWADA